MDPIPEIEALRAELQQRHVEHVQTELDLIKTFLDMGRVEYGLGEYEAGAKSLSHSRQAITGARAGIDRIASVEVRTSLSARINSGEIELERFEAEVLANGGRSAVIQILAGWAEYSLRQDLS